MHEDRCAQVQHSLHIFCFERVANIRNSVHRTTKKCQYASSAAAVALKSSEGQWSSRFGNRPLTTKGPFDSQGSLRAGCGTQRKFLRTLMQSRQRFKYNLRCVRDEPNRSLHNSKA